MPVPNQDLDFRRHMLWSLYFQWFEVRGDCSGCWYWWNCWPSIFKHSFMISWSPLPLMWHGRRSWGQWWWAKLCGIFSMEAKQKQTLLSMGRRVCWNQMSFFCPTALKTCLLTHTHTSRSNLKPDLLHLWRFLYSKRPRLVPSIVRWPAPLLTGHLL